MRTSTVCGGGYHIYDFYTLVGFVDKTQTIMCSILGRKLRQGGCVMWISRWVCHVISRWVLCDQ